MKLFLVLSTLVSLLIANLAHAQLSQTSPVRLVLGVNLDPDQSQFRFPCVLGSANVFFCDDTVIIKDSNCKKTLDFQPAESGVNIVCQLSTGKSQLIAEAKGELIMDPTQDGSGSVLLKMNSKVSFEKTSQNKYELVIKD